MRVASPRERDCGPYRLDERRRPLWAGILGERTGKPYRQ